LSKIFVDEDGYGTTTLGSCVQGEVVMEFRASKAIMGASLALLPCGLGTSARADAIPYATPGVLKAVDAAFGDLIAW
jgi:hypothetical protein